MKPTLYYFFVSIVLCWSCSPKQGVAEAKKSTAPVLDSTAIQRVSTSLLTLSPEAKTEIEDFEDFQNLKTLLETMRDANPYYIQKYADSVQNSIVAFKDNRSSRLKVTTIDSRITVLSTASGLLAQQATKEDAESNVLLEANEKLIKAYNSLVIQLNELSLAIPDNISEELLRDSESLRDTVVEP